MTLRILHQSITVALLLASIASISCSLDYFEQNAEPSSSPEFVFFDTDFTRVKDNAVSVTMNVEQVEQYTDGGLTFAEKPRFTLYDADENISAVGHCDILSSDTEKDEYTFFGNVSIISYEHEAQVEAENLRWSGETDMFSGAVGDTVSIFVGNNNAETMSSDNKNTTELLVEGKGFSASGIDFSYSFTGPVSGSIIEH